MMLTAHILAGAALASAMPASAAGKVGAFGIGFVSHYALDALPHWERPFKPHYNDQFPKPPPWPKTVFIQGVLDTVVGLSLFAYLVSILHIPNMACVLLGAAGATMPDLVDNPPWWKQLAKRAPVWKTLSSLHSKVHMSYKKQRQLPPFTGLATQLVTAGLALLVLLERNYRQ